MPDVLVIGGAGYVGSVVVDHLRGVPGVDVTSTSRQTGRADRAVTSGADLAALLDEADFARIVVMPQLAADGVDWLVESVDGPRWVVFSSAQLAWDGAAPGDDMARAREAKALARGATVLRPSMIFGHAGDVNVTRLVRFLNRWRVPVLVGDGSQLVQPVHVDDVAALVGAHLASSVPASGCYEVGGDERLSSRQLLERLCRLVGVRMRPVGIPRALLRPLAALPLPGLRRDQVLRLDVDKTVDTTAARRQFGWQPRPLSERLAQAVREVLDAQPPEMAAR